MYISKIFFISKSISPHSPEGIDRLSSNPKKMRAGNCITTSRPALYCHCGNKTLKNLSHGFHNISSTLKCSFRARPRM